MTPVSQAGYDWSFLHPTASVTLVAGQSTLPLPDDFGGIEGRISVTFGGQGCFAPVDEIGEGLVRQAYSENPAATGRPMGVSVQQLKGTTVNSGQRSQLYVFPNPDSPYVLSFQYYLLPDATDGTRPYAYGGANHTETILESCLSIAEERLDDMQGVHHSKWLERLMASIVADRKMKPQKIGYNRDRSDQIRNWPRTNHGFAPITINGTLYG